MAFRLQDFQSNVNVAFRVEVHDIDHPRRNSTFDRQGNMRARDAGREANASACQDHLLGRPRTGPFISFTTDWNGALRRRQRLIDQGSTEVLIIAVWLKGLGRCYDAFRIAQNLHINRTDLSLSTELLVHGGVLADEYRILATSWGIGQTTYTVFELGGLRVDAEVPGNFNNGTGGGLKDEIQAHTGTRDELKYIILALSISGIPCFIETLDERHMEVRTSYIGIGRGWRFERVSV